MTPSRRSPPAAAACLLLLRGAAARGRPRGGDRAPAAAPGLRELSTPSAMWYVDWDGHQCVQNCMVNFKSVRASSCGGRVLLPQEELFDSSRECCDEMLSWLSYSECIRGYADGRSDSGQRDGGKRGGEDGGRMGVRAHPARPRDGQRNNAKNGDDDGCPESYSPSINYSERDEVTLDGGIYRCKTGPTWPWCNMFPPDYEVHASSQVVHQTKDDLGWETIGVCGRPGDAPRTKTTTKTTTVLNKDNDSTRNAGTAIITVGTTRGGIVKNGNRNANGRRKKNESLRDIMDTSWDASRDKNKDKNKDKSKEKDKGKNKAKRSKYKDNRKSKEKGKGNGKVIVAKNTDENEDKNGDKSKGKDIMDGGNNNKKDKGKGKDKGKDKGKGKSKNGNKDKDKGKNNNKDKDKGKNKNKGKDKDKGKDKGKNKVQNRNFSQGQQTVVLHATDDVYVDRRDPDEGYDDATLQYDLDDVRSLVRFDLSGAYEEACVLERAALRLYPLAPCDGGTNVEVVMAPGGHDVDWSGITWTTAPRRAGPVSAQPQFDGSYDVEEGEWFEVDVTKAVEWSTKVRRKTYVVFRLSAETNGACVLASAEYEGGARGPTLELHARPAQRGQRRPRAPDKHLRPANRPRDYERDDSEHSADVYTDGILLQREFDPCDIARYLDGDRECVDGLACYHPGGAASGFGTCRRIGKFARKDEPCDASFGRRACGDAGCACLGDDGAGLGDGGTRTGVCRIPPGAAEVTKRQSDTITVTDIIRREGESCRIERYLDGEMECVDGLACYEPNGLLSGWGICTRIPEFAGRDWPCNASFGASACRDDGFACLGYGGAALDGVGTGVCARPPPPPGRDSDYTPFRQSETQEEWYVDYSLGDEGQCVRNCEGGPLCGGLAEVWEETFSTPEVCCKQKLWWMGRSQCVPGLAG